MMLPKRILFISNLYPNPIFPNMATFNRQQIAALQEYFEIEVVAPVPWPVLIKNKLRLWVREEGGIIVHHPTYYYPPSILRSFYGEFFYSSIRPVAEPLLEKKKFDLVYSSWLYPDSWAAARLAARYQLPLFVKVHGTDVNRLRPGTAITKSSLHVAQQAKKVICVSKALKERLVSLGVPDSKLEVHYNGIDRSLFFPMDRQEVRRRLKVEPDEFLVLYVGNLKKEKGIYELIASYSASMKSIPKKSRLVIIGAGAYRDAAERQVSSLDLSERVQFLGSQPLGAIAHWMNAASVLCLPSYMEGVPNVILEALACGTNVIATAVGGIPELDSGDGRLILTPPQDIDSLVAALKVASTENQQVRNLPPFLRSWHENARQLSQIFL